MRNDYRDRATECLQRANGANDPILRAELVEMALAWIRLHDQAEKNAQSDLTYETPPPRQTVTQMQQQPQRRSTPGTE